MLTMATRTIGESVKFYRKLRGLTMEELGVRIESNHSYISQLEANKMVPGSDVLGRLADALGVPADALLGRQLESDGTEEELMRKLTLQYGGPDADWRELARWFEVYRQLDPESRKAWLGVLRLNASRARRSEEGEQEQQAQQG